MRKNKSLILNSQILEVISSAGHFQKIVICDPGLPIPVDAYTIDISLVKNIPSFIDTFIAIVNELDLERIILANEIKTNNQKLLNQILEIVKTQQIKVDYLSHNNLKALSHEAICFIRTGETSVYANVILEAGVHFDKE